MIEVKKLFKNFKFNWFVKIAAVVIIGKVAPHGIPALALAVTASVESDCDSAPLMVSAAWPKAAPAAAPNAPMLQVPSMARKLGKP